MAKIAELNAAGVEEWLEGRPQIIKEMMAKYPPNLLYRMGDTGHRVFIVAYGEGGTVRVYVSGQFNCVMFEREVFGVDPETLEECDFPGEDEHLGALFESEPYY